MTRIKEKPIKTSDLRFSRPLYTIREAAMYLAVPESTLATWVHGIPSIRKAGRSRQVVSSIADGRGPRIPFVGLAEGMIAAAFRHAGVSMQHIRKAVAILNEQIGMEHALASKRLYMDGARILYDYAVQKREDQMEGLTVVVNQQRVFTEVVKEYLTRIEYAKDGWASKVILPITERHVVEVDPARAFGRPIFVHGAARVEDLLDRWKAGESLVELAQDFGVPPDEAEDVLRAILRAAA